MNKFKFEAFLTEFPFLKTLLIHPRHGVMRKAEHCNAIKIARVDNELLSFVPKYFSWDGSMVSIMKREIVSFVTNDGALIEKAVIPSEECGSNYAHSDTYRSEGETVLEAIARHRVAKRLKYIVLVRSGFRVVDHSSEPDFEVKIFKAAKGENLAALIQAAEAAALDEVRAEANF